AEALQHCALLRDHVEQGLLYLIRHVLVSNVDVEPWRVSRANAGAQLAGAVIGPCARRLQVDGNFRPVVEQWSLAAGQNWDRLVAELYITDTARRDSNPQLLVRQRW